MEELYNGIRLPDVWPPRDMDDMSLSELPVPYLENRPDVALIDVGRQLFVDDFLIEENWLEKRFHQAVLDETPVLAPETPMEWNKGVAPVAAPFTDGCWYDPADGVYRLYYHAGWFDGTALAVSADGRHFTRKMLDNQVGTNRIFAKFWFFTASFFKACTASMRFSCSSISFDTGEWVMCMRDPASSRASMALSGKQRSET